MVLEWIRKLFLFIVFLFRWPFVQVLEHWIILMAYAVGIHCNPGRKQHKSIHKFPEVAQAHHGVAPRKFFYLWGLEFT